MVWKDRLFRQIFVGGECLTIAGSKLENVSATRLLHWQCHALPPQKKKTTQCRTKLGGGRVLSKLCQTFSIFQTLRFFCCLSQGQGGRMSIRTWWVLRAGSNQSIIFFAAISWWLLMSRSKKSSANWTFFQRHSWKFRKGFANFLRANEQLLTIFESCWNFLGIFGGFFCFFCQVMMLMRAARPLKMNVSWRCWRWVGLTFLGPGDRCGLVSIKGKFQKNVSLLPITMMLVTPSIPIWITYYPCPILIVMIYILSRATVDGPHLTCRICCINRCKDGGSCSYLSKTTWKGRTNIYMNPLTCWAKKEDVWRMLVLVSQCTWLEYWFLQLWWFVYQSCDNEDDSKGSIWFLVNCNRHVLQIWELGYPVSSIHIKFQAV